MTGVLVWGHNDGTQQVPFFLLRTCEEWFPETLKSEEDSSRSGLWLHLNLFGLLTVFSATILRRACLFKFLFWSKCLILSHLVDSQHHESLSSLYPYHSTQLLKTMRQLIII